MFLPRPKVVAGAASRSSRPTPANPGACRLESARPLGTSPNATAPSAGQLFFPQSRALGIDQGNYSPDVLKKIVYAGTQLTSFAQGSAAIDALSGLSVATKQVERITEKIGWERVEQRDEAVRSFRVAADRSMQIGGGKSSARIGVATVMMDGGRLKSSIAAIEILI